MAWKDTDNGDCFRDAKAIATNFMRAAAVAALLAPSAGSAQDFDAGVAAYSAGDYASALSEWRPLAERGDAHAQNNLGVMYQEGDGVPQNHAEAVRWYRMAAEQGHADAQANLGLNYEAGDGVPTDFITAHTSYNISAANGHTRSGEQRDSLAKTMTPADVSEAQRRARVCTNSGYRDCGW